MNRFIFLCDRPCVVWSTWADNSVMDWLTLFTWLWRWLPLTLSKRQSPTTVLFRTTLTRTMTQDDLLMLLGSNHFLWIGFSQPNFLVLFYTKSYPFVPLWVASWTYQRYASSTFSLWPFSLPYLRPAGPVFRKHWKLFAPAKPFLVNLYLKAEAYMSETSCMKGTSAHMKNIWIKQRCNHKVWFPGSKLSDLQETGTWPLNQLPVPDPPYQLVPNVEGNLICVY